MADEEKSDMPNIDSPEAWRVECELAVFHSSVLLRLAKIPGGIGSAIAEIVRTAPRSKRELENPSVSTLFARIILKAGCDNWDDELFRSAVRYFTNDLIAMPPERRRMLEASVTGAMMGFVMG
jgi:hypothetical protein